MRHTIVAIALVSASACGGSSDSSASGSRGPEVRFELPAEGELLALDRAPFPSDLFLVADDDGIETIQVGGIETLAPRFAEVMKQGLATLDGFGTTTPIFFHIEGALDPESLPADPEASVMTGASVFLVDVEPGAGARPLHPIEIRYDARSARLALNPQIGRPLRERTTYAAVVTRRVLGVGAHGGFGPVQPSSQFRIVRDEDRSIRRGGPVQRAGDRYAEAFDIVTSLENLSREDIACMTVFTTQSITRDLTSIRRQIGRAPAPRFERDDPDIAILWDDAAELDELFGVPEAPLPGADNPGGITHDAIRAVVSGTFESPWYKSPEIGIADRALTSTHDDDSFQSVEGEPELQRIDDVPVTFVIPSTPQPPGGYPVVIDQHGLGGQRSNMFGMANSFAGAGYVVVGIDAVGHGMRFARIDERHNLTGAPGPDGFAENPADQVPIGLFEAFLNIVAIRDNFRQTSVDLMALVQMIGDPELDLAVVGSPRLDASRISFVGNSFGSVIGAVFVAVEPRVQAAVFNVGGAGISNYLLVNSPAIGGSNLETLSGLFGFSLDPYPDRFDPFVALSQTLLDAGDPANYARHLVDEPLSIGGLGRNRPRHVLQIEVMGDEVVPNPANEYLAIAAGLDLLEPFAAPVPGLGTLASPTSGNRVVDGIEVTAVLIQQNPAAHGSNLAWQNGSRRYVPGFPHPGPDPFPRLPERVRIRHPIAQWQDMIVDFLDGASRGRAPADVPTRPDAFER